MSVLVSLPTKTLTLLNQGPVLITSISLNYCAGHKVHSDNHSNECLANLILPYSTYFHTGG